MEPPARRAARSQTASRQSAATVSAEEGGSIIECAAEMQVVVMWTAMAKITDSPAQMADAAGVSACLDPATEPSASSKDDMLQSPQKHGHETIFEHSYKILLSDETWHNQIDNNKCNICVTTFKSK